MAKIGIYARVSKDDGSQDPNNQLIPLRNLAKALQGDIVEEFVDLGSGAGSADRKEFLRMLEVADKRKINLLLIWSLDRLSREGISNTLGYLERLKRNGIAVKSLSEPWLDTRDESLGQLLIAIFSWVAEQERKRLIERIRAGIAKVKAGGKILGRPKGAKDKKIRKKSGYLLRYHKK